MGPRLGNGSFGSVPGPRMLEPSSAGMCPAPKTRLVVGLPEATGQLGPPGSALSHPFLGDGSTTKMDHREKLVPLF